MINSANGVPGQVSRAGLDKFDILKPALKDNCVILEIGCAWGKSTWKWLDVLPPKGQLDILDAWEYNQSERHDRKQEFIDHGGQYILDDVGEYDQRKVWEFTTGHHPEKRKIRDVISMTSQQYFDRKGSADYDLVFLDGDHSHECVAAELAYFAHVDILCGDDYQGEFPGLMNAVNEFYAEHYTEFALVTDTSCSSWFMFRKHKFKLTPNRGLIQNEA
jgi:hypothetical protein